MPWMTGSFAADMTVKAFDFFQAAAGRPPYVEASVETKALFMNGCTIVWDLFRNLVRNLCEEASMRDVRLYPFATAAPCDALTAMNPLSDRNVRALSEAVPRCLRNMKSQGS